MNNTIAFITAHKHPSVDSTYNTLKDIFPGHNIVTFQIVDILKKRPLFLMVNFLFTLKEYGSQILSRQKTLSNCFFRTTYIFQRVRKIIPELVKSQNCVFSFQIGSVFDTSTPGLPHFIYTDHSHLENLRYPGYSRKDLYSDRWIALEKTIYQNATLCFTRSSNIQHSIIHDYDCPAEKVVCVYAGSNAMPQNAKQLNNWDYSNKNILFVGNYWERKGGPELVAAFEKIHEVEPEATLTIIGASPELNVENCTVVGKVGLEELENYFSRASVFCLPSKWEPFGIAILEAMQHKLPVVSTKIGAIPDFIKPGINGYLVESGEIDKLAASLLVLIEDPVRCSKFGKAGYEIVNKNYTWEKTGVKIRRAIDAALGNIDFTEMQAGTEEFRYPFLQAKHHDDA